MIGQIEIASTNPHATSNKSVGYTRTWLSVTVRLALIFPYVFSNRAGFDGDAGDPDQCVPCRCCHSATEIKTEPAAAIFMQDMDM